MRRLWRSPLFTSVTVATLAIAIGANTAIFSVLDCVLLKPLPYSHPEDLVGVWHTAPGVNIAELNSSPSLYFTYREDGRTFEDVGLWTEGSATVTGLAEPERVSVLRVTDGVLPLLGVPPIVGRPFSREDDQAGSPPTVILSHAYWEAKLGGSRDAIGKRLTLDGEAHEVIGVMPRDFRFLDVKAALFLPLQLDRAKVFLGQFSYESVARLKPGVTIAQAEADVARLLPLSFDRFPPPPGYNKKMFEEARIAPRLRPFKQDLVGNVGSVLWVLMGTILLVLLIACANVANLLLVRVEGRQQELAVRVALGASRGRIASELLLESVILGLAGGVVGLALAYGLLRFLVFLAPANLPRLETIALGPATFLFTFVAALGAGLLLGLVPVLKYAAPHVATGLRSSGRSSSASRERHRARNGLVVVQVALALVLLVGSGLMVRSSRALRDVRPGFAPEGVLTLRISIPEAQVKDEEAAARMQHAILDKVAELPGVTSAALGSAIPLDGDGWRDPVFVEDRAYSEGQIPALRLFRFVVPGFLKTMGTPLVAGRDLTWSDAYDRLPVVMVSDGMARELWGSATAALGKRLRETSNSAWREVVGVVADVHADGLDKAAPTTVYWPILANDFEGSGMSRSLALVLRSPRTGSEGLLKDVQGAIWAVNSNLPLARVRTLREVYERSLARTSFTMVMLLITAGMALLLGVVGIYGVTSYAISQRTREIGIRLALGALAPSLTWMVVLEGLKLAALGALCGLGVAFGLSRLLTSLLFGVSAADPATFAVVAATLLSASMIASYLPARRMTRVDPVAALRAE
ncbi:MAG TPA: ABC transporter permease [Vicinamibacteria bacterium]|nr:ABC transporter permease [Vicinamibacteria bacterium]